MSESFQQDEIQQWSPESLARYFSETTGADMNKPDVEWKAEPQGGDTEDPDDLEMVSVPTGWVTAGVLMELRRIADALETLSGSKAHCDGVNPETGEPCVLGERHVGYHVPVDGRKPWLDTE